MVWLCFATANIRQIRDGSYEFFDGLPRHLVGFGCLAGCDSLLPKHVTARFGGHAPKPGPARAGTKGPSGLLDVRDSGQRVGFRFLESRFEILSSDPGVNFQTIFAPDLALGRWWRGQRSSDRRAVKCSIAEQTVSKTEAPMPRAKSLCDDRKRGRDRASERRHLVGSSFRTSSVQHRSHME